MKKRWIIIILIIIVLFLAFGISIKKTYSSLLVLPEDYRSSMMVDYYDETKVRHIILGMITMHFFYISLPAYIPIDI